MISDICFYNNKLFIPNFEDTETFLSAYTYKQDKKLHSEKFEECFKIKLPVKYMHIKEITLKVVNNLVTGIKCILIFIFDYDGFKYSFLYSDASRKKLTCISFPPVFLTQNFPSSDLFVTDGPAFLFHSCDKFNFYSLPFNACNFLNYQNDFSARKNFKILQFKCFDFVQKQAFFFISMTVDFNSCQSINIIAFISNSNNTEIKYEQLPVTLFFPTQYQCILKAVAITKFIPFYKSKSICLNNIGCQESITVICTSNDCLVFCNGVLKYCCKLTIPLHEIMCINVEFSNASAKSMSLVLISENETAHLVRWNENICEVVKCWTDVKASTTGDMVMNGSKQLLLLKNTDVDSWQKSCILTDIVSFIPIDLLSQNSMPDDCLKITLAGLEKKIQLGKSAIAEVEHGISQKAAAAVDSLIRLSEFKVNEESVRSCNSFRESLIDLILYKDENKSAEYLCPPTEQTVKLLNEKQRFIGDQWLLCLHFMNESVKCICNPSIKVLHKDKPVLSTQKLFAPSNDSQSSNETCCSEIKPKSKFTILLKFSVLTFQDDVVTFILCWLDGSATDFDNEILLSKEEKVLRQHQLCFSKTFSIGALLNFEIKRGLSSSEDLLFTKSSQQRTVLNISSLYSDISHLKSVLLNSDANLIYLKDSSNCIIFNSKKSHLFEISMIFNNLKEKMATIEAFTRDEKECLLLVHFLYQYLPDDVLIVPSLQSEDENFQLKKYIICAIKDEIDLLVSSLNIHNISEDLRKNYPKLITSNNVGTIAISKEVYHRIRRALAKKEFFVDSMLKNFL